MEHKSLLIYLDNENMLDCLTDEEAGKVMKALIHYANSGEIPQFEERAMIMAFSKMRQDADRNEKSYAERCAKNRETAIKREWQKKNPNGTDEEYEEYRRRLNDMVAQSEAQKQRADQYQRMVEETAKRHSLW